MGNGFSCWSPDRTHGVKKKDGVGAGDGLFMHGRRRQRACWVWASACMTRKPCRLAPRQTRHGPGGNSAGQQTCWARPKAFEGPSKSWMGL